MRDGALVCTINSRSWGNNCDKCDKWRLVVWKNGAHEREAGHSIYNGITFSTKAGYFYAAHDPCANGDNFPLCGIW